MIAVSVAESIFLPARQLEVQEGATLADIVAEAGLDEWFWQGGRIALNGNYIDDNALWPLVKPKACDRCGNQVVVEIHLVPQGGGRSTRKVLSTAVTLAFAVAAGLVSGGILAVPGGAIGAGLISGGLGVAGVLAGRLLAPAPIKPKQGGANADKPVSNAGISQNQLTPLATLPTVFGSLLYSPPLVAPPYTTYTNAVVTVHAVVGLAGRFDISDIQLNGADSELFTDATIQTREGDTSDAILTICDKTVIEDRAGSILQNFLTELNTTKNERLIHQSNPDQDLPQFQYYRTRGIADEIILRLFWGAGQVRADTGEKALTPFRIEIRPVDGGSPNTWLKLPVLHFQDIRKGKAYRQQIRIIFDIPDGRLTDVYSLYDTVSRHAVAAYRTTGSGQSFQYQAESYFAYPAAPSDLLPVMTASTTSGVTITATNEAGGAAWQVGDNTAARWITGAGVTSANLLIDLGSAQTVKAYNINCNVTPTRAPVSWVLRGSTDNFASSNVVLQTITGEFGWGAATADEQRLYNVKNFGSYRYYRWDFTAVESGDRIEIRELSLYTILGRGTDVGGGIFATYVGMDDDGFRIYLDPATWPQVEYEVRIQRGLTVVQTDFDGNGVYTWGASALLANFFGYVTSTFSAVRVGQSVFSSEVIVEVFQTWSNDYPFGDFTGKNIALIAVEAPNLVIQSISAQFTSLLKIWNGAAWVGGTTDNPAAIARAILVGERGLVANPPGTSKLETDAFEDWYDACVTAGYSCNMVFEGTAEEALNLVYACGWATKRRPPWGVVREEDRSAENPVQVFTGLNSRGITVTRGFADLPHAFRIEYLDEDNDAKPASLIVYADGYTAANATLFEGISYEGITNASKVYLRGLLDIQQLYERDRTISFAINEQHVISKRGDLVALNHDVLFTASKTATVATVLTGGGNITGLVLEEETILSEIGGSVGMIIAYRDGTNNTVAVTQGANNFTVTITTPFANPGVNFLDAGVRVGLGVTSAEFIRCLVAAITPKDDRSADIVLIDEAPRIHAWPYPDATTDVDLDFVNQRYFWNGEVRDTSDFTTWVLGAGTFDSHGLTPAADTDITILLSGTGWTFPGSYAAQVYPTSTPGTNRAALALDDGTTNEQVTLRQVTTGDLAGVVMDGGVTQANVGAAITLNAKNGAACSFQTNSVRFSTDQATGTEDTSCTMPTVTTLRIGRRSDATSQFLGAIGRIVLFDATKNQTLIDALADAMKAW